MLPLPDPLADVSELAVPPEVLWCYAPDSLEQVAADARTTLSKWSRECFSSSAAWLRGILMDLWHRQVAGEGGGELEYMQFVVASALLARVAAAAADATKPSAGDHATTSMSLQQVFPSFAQMSLPDAVGCVAAHQLPTALQSFWSIPDASDGHWLELALVRRLMENVGANWVPDKSWCVEGSGKPNWQPLPEPIQKS